MAAGQWLGLVATLAFFGWLAWAASSERRSGLSNEAVDWPDQTYSAYTTAFDREVSASAVALALATSGVRRGVPRTAQIPNLVERQAIAEQAYELGVASAAAASLKNLVAGFSGEVSVGILIDHSGSMIDRIPALAGQIKAAAESLVATGVDHSVLGFTTMGWHGGLAREAWIRSRRPAYPGRLCSLLHIVYNDFGTSMSDQEWRAMLDPNSFFENVDGEALQWAVERLKVRPTPIKLLIVVSDGAPVDDSTLLANGPNILVRHIHKVIGEIEHDPSVRLGAIGLGDEYSVEEYYSCSVQAGEPEQFLDSVNDLLALMMASKAPPESDKAERTAIS